MFDQDGVCLFQQDLRVLILSALQLHRAGLEGGERHIGMPLVEDADALTRMSQRANFLDVTLGAGGVVPGYAQLLIDAIAAAVKPRVEIESANLAEDDSTLHGRLAVAVRGIEEQDADVSFELPPVKQINPFTQEEMQTPPRLLQGLRAVLLSIADFDRAARLPTVHRYLTGEALAEKVQRNIELLIGSPVGVNTPWRQVVERRARRR
jgi:hypothetical protein